MGNKLSLDGVNLNLRGNAPKPKGTPPVEMKNPSLARVISTIDTESTYSMSIAGMKLIPIGSAVYTNSGSLQESGIRAIIHATSGSSSRHGTGLTPTLQSVANCVKNSLALAKQNNHGKIAIPFIGGLIFRGKIGVDDETLAKTVFKSVLDNKGTDIKVAMVVFGAEATMLFQQVLHFFLEQEQYAIHRSSIEVVSGDITDFKTHGADVIVNAANTELKFQSGVSAAVARASGDPIAIEREAAKIVSQFINAYINQTA